MSKEGETVSLFHAWPNTLCSELKYLLCKLDKVSWEMFWCTDFSTGFRDFHCIRLNIDMLSTNHFLFIIRNGRNVGVFVNPKLLSLRDIAIRKILHCWSPSTSFKTFVYTLNLPRLIKQQYLAMFDFDYLKSNKNQELDVSTEVSQYDLHNEIFNTKRQQQMINSMKQINDARKQNNDAVRCHRRKLKLSLDKNASSRSNVDSELSSSFNVDSEHVDSLKH